MVRVGVAGPVYPDSFADNILTCLPDVGVDAVALGAALPRLESRYLRAGLDLGMRASKRLSARLQGSIVRRAQDAEVAVVLTTQSLDPGLVGELARSGVRTALWFPDAVGNMSRNLMFVAPYERLYLKDRLLVDRLKAVQGLPAAYLPEACNPAWHCPSKDVPGTDAQVAVVGNIYPTRARLLQRLISDDIPLRLYGAPIPQWLPEMDAVQALHAGRAVWRSEKASIFRRSRAVLNNLHPSELDSVNCRLFEAAASGAVVLAEHRPALLDLFEPGEEVLAFSSYEDLVRHIRALEQDPEIGLKIGDAASSRALREHTYQHRLHRILEDLL